MAHIKQPQGTSTANPIPFQQAQRQEASRRTDNLVWFPTSHGWRGQLHLQVAGSTARPNRKLLTGCGNTIHVNSFLSSTCVLSEWQGMMGRKSCECVRRRLFKWAINCLATCLKCQRCKMLKKQMKTGSERWKERQRLRVYYGQIDGKRDR